VPAVRYLVRGRVQGVGFRWFVLGAARELGVAGWVRNRSDGGVEVAAEGAADALSRLRHALASGPPGARVDDVSAHPVQDSEPLPHPFRILE
jgi:acylphosphatase